MNGERLLSRESNGCSGSKAPVRAAGGDGCNPSEAVSQLASDNAN